MFSLDKGVIMTGNMVDTVEPEKVKKLTVTNYATQCIF